MCGCASMVCPCGCGFLSVCPCGYVCVGVRVWMLLYTSVHMGAVADPGGVRGVNPPPFKGWFFFFLHVSI